MTQPTQQQVEREEIQRRAAMEWHLTSNFYPPIPGAALLVGIALEALAIVNSYDAQYGVNTRSVLEQELALPDGMLVNGKPTMQPWDVIDWLRLDSMVYDVLELDGAAADNEPEN